MNIKFIQQKIFHNIFLPWFIAGIVFSEGRGASCVIWRWGPRGYLQGRSVVGGQEFDCQPLHILHTARCTVSEKIKTNCSHQLPKIDHHHFKCVFFRVSINSPFFQKAPFPKLCLCVLLLL